jgi:hypothetical protein
VRRDGRLASTPHSEEDNGGGRLIIGSKPSRSWFQPVGYRNRDRQSIPRQEALDETCDPHWLFRANYNFPDHFAYVDGNLQTEWWIVRCAKMSRFCAAAKGGQMKRVEDMLFVDE